MNSETPSETWYQQNGCWLWILIIAALVIWAYLTNDPSQHTYEYDPVRDAPTHRTRGGDTY